MRLLTVPFVVVLAAIGLYACGGGAHRAGTTRALISVAGGSRHGKGRYRPLPLWAQRTPFTDAVTMRLLKVRKGELHNLPAIERALLDYGVPASASETRAVTPIVKRYYEIAASGDGRKACSIITRGATKQLALLSYRRLGIRPSRGGSCQTIATSIFIRRHRELTAPVTINGAIADGDHAFAIVSSRTLRDDMIALERKRGAWVIANPVGVALLLDWRRL